MSELPVRKALLNLTANVFHELQPFRYGSRRLMAATRARRGMILAKRFQ
jgi:hypothetical protein